MDMAQEQRYIHSERLRFLGHFFFRNTPQLATKLFEAAVRDGICPFNLAGWMNRIECVASRIHGNSNVDSEDVKSLINAMSSTFSYEGSSQRLRTMRSSRNFLQLELSKRVKLADISIDKQFLIDADFDVQSLIIAGYRVEAWMDGKYVSGSGTDSSGNLRLEGAGRVVRAENVRNSRCGRKRYYMIQDYEQTRIVEWPSMESRHYTGTPAQFDETRCHDGAGGYGMFKGTESYVLHLSCLLRPSQSREN